MLRSRLMKAQFLACGGCFLFVSSRDRERQREGGREGESQGERKHSGVSSYKGINPIGKGFTVMA